MEHISDGRLRETIDAAHPASAAERLHLAGCTDCARNLESLRAASTAARDALGGTPQVDVAGALRGVRQRVSVPHTSPAWYKPAVAAAFAALFIGALVFTPLGGYASSFLTIFEPRVFTPIEVSRSDLRQLHLLPQADDVGTQRVVSKPRRQAYSGIAQAQQHVDFPILRPSVLPKDLGPVHEYRVFTPGILTFTFSAAKARTFEERSHKTLPPMPRTLDGTVVRLQTGYVFNGHYEAAAPGKGRRNGADTRFIEIVEARAPHVSSSGASLDELERYLLSMPNVSPALAQQIRALGDIENTVPVPVVVDRQTARRVTVRGAQGLAIGDNTGLGAGVMWQSGGMVYIVAGPVSMDEVMTVADGLR